MAMDDDDLLDCFVHLPSQEGTPYRLDFETIALNQQNDPELLARAKTAPREIVKVQMSKDVSLYCYIPAPNKPWKIYLPKSLVSSAIDWYHLALGHIGSSRLYQTMAMHFYHPRLQSQCEELVKRCDTCQRSKLVGRGHGDLASREVAILPWSELAVDCIGPWELKVGNQTVSFDALTTIDTVTNLVEAVRLDDKTAEHVALQFENSWLSRYPRPIRCVHDQGGEFIGWEFQQMLHRHGIHPRPITAKNPQANSICERMHQSVGNTLRVLNRMKPPAGIHDAKQLVDTALATAVYALRCSYNSQLQTTPGGIAFGRDMVLNLPLITDLEMLQQHRQQLVDKRLLEANRKRFSFDYQVGQQVLKLVHKPNKLDDRATGPHRVEKVHANGTLTIRLNDTTVERISIRRVKPYFS